MACPGAQHHLPCGHLLPLSPQPNPQPRRPPAVERHPVHQRAAADDQVRPSPRRLQVGFVGRDPPPARAADRIAGHTLRPWRVQVRVPGIAQRQRRLLHALVHRAPRAFRRPVDRHRPIQPVLAGRAVGIRLEPPEERQHRVRRPSLAPHLRPFVERRSDPPDGDLAIHHAAAAQAAAAPIQMRLLRPCAPGHQPGVLPLMLQGGREDDPQRVRAPHLVRRLVRAPVPSGLQQQHPPRRVFRQPGRHDGARRPAAHHDHVPRRIRHAAPYRNTSRRDPK